MVSILSNQLCFILVQYLDRFLLERTLQQCIRCICCNKGSMIGKIVSDILHVNWYREKIGELLTSKISNRMDHFDLNQLILCIQVHYNCNHYFMIQVIYVNIFWYMINVLL